jgi:CIC family chloride channel protein
VHSAFLRRLLKWRVWLAELKLPGGVQVILLWAGLVGLLGGLSAALFRELLDRTQHLFTGSEGDVVESFWMLDWWWRLLVPAAGGLLAGLIMHFGSRLAPGKSTTDFMEAVAVGDGVIRVRQSLVKSASSLASLASGGSIGREGVMVQLSAMLASLTGRLARFSTPRLRLLVACGAAAGIASAYKAPIAGALFVAEIVLGSIAMESFGPLVFASVVATMVTRSFSGSAPIFEVPHFQLVSPWELFPYLALGLIGGGVAPWFLRVLRKSEQLFSKIKAPVFVRMALGGLIVGALATYRPEVCGNGYSVVDSILHTSWAWQMLVVVLVFKILATAATSGSGAVGGVFTPTLFVGAAVGSLFGQLVQYTWPTDVANPNAYALVGMGCLLAGTTHAPLMAILMIFEMTLSYEIVLPLMLACVTSYYVSTMIERRSIYSESLRRKEPISPRPVSDLRVQDLFRPDAVFVLDTARFREIAEKFATHRHNYLYVVNGAHALRGAISLHDIKEYLNEPDFGGVVIAGDLMHENLPVVTPETSLPDALERFSRHDGNRLPVVSDPESRRLLGSLSSMDLLLTLAHGFKSTSETAG